MRRTTIRTRLDGDLTFWQAGVGGYVYQEVGHRTGTLGEQVLDPWRNDGTTLVYYGADAGFLRCMRLVRARQRRNLLRYDRDGAS